MKKIFISVGEPSGDLHGSNLIRYVRRFNPDVSFVGFGGPRMAAAGCELHEDLTRSAVMGFFRIVRYVPRLWRLYRRAEHYFDTERPDAVVLIDYPGFNLRLARAAHRRGIPVFYYGVPQLWAWAPWRVKKVRRDVDYSLCKLPFEQPWLRQRGVDATFVGHPYFDQLHDQKLDRTFIDNFFQPGSDPSDGNRPPLVLILPGSRNQEIANNLRCFYRSAEKIRAQLPRVRLAVAAFSEPHAERARQMARRGGLDVEVYVNRTQELMTLADCAMACSGSVSLELMYHRVPTVILYRINIVNDVIQRFLRRVKYITLVNLLAVDDIHPADLTPFDPDSPDAEEVVFPEYLTRHDKSSRIAGHVVEWLTEPLSRRRVVARLDDLRRHYAAPGASERAARFIMDKLGIGARLRERSA
jgi:lipid-A-disaccharide synthase